MLRKSRTWIYYICLTRIFISSKQCHQKIQHWNRFCG